VAVWFAAVSCRTEVCYPFRRKHGKTDDVLDDAIAARECVRLAGLAEDPELRERLINLAREWMAMAMRE
jgi:hypothetical protein